LAASAFSRRNAKTGARVLGGGRIASIKWRNADTIPQIPFDKNFWVTPTRIITALRRAYGDLFRMDTPRGKLVCAAGLDANRAFLVENDAKLSYGQGWDHVAPAIAEMGRGIVFMDGPDHRWFRRVLQPAYAPAAIARYVPLMHEIVRGRISKWRHGSTIPLYDEINAITFDITTAMVLGLRDEQHLRKLNRLFRQVTLRRPMPEPPAEMQRRFSAALLPIIRERMAQPTHDVLSRMIRAGQAADGAGAADQVNTLIVAGHFTTAGLCSHMLLDLDRRPYAARLREEQRDHQSPAAEALAKMRYLHCALLESGRVISPVPHLPRGFATEMQFRDCELRPGDVLLCSVAGTHMDGDVFADPERDDPDRFAPPRNEHRSDPVALATFGAGARHCIGAFLAETMIKVIVHHVIRRFALAPLPDAYKASVSLPILRPMNGMPVQLRALRRAH
jgi:cytochrome P450